uniref:Rho GDP-dissociation inhibitor 1 n=2 Tax=Ursidae TaxID=9632 RepID=G1MGH3_AILME
KSYLAFGSWPKTSPSTQCVVGGPVPDATPARPCGSGGGPGQRCRWPGAGGLLGALRGTRENVPGGVQCPAVCARHTSDTCLRPGTAREPPKSRGEERLGDRLPSSRAGTPGRTVGSRTTVAATRRALGHLGDRSRRTGCALEAVTLPCALGWQPNPENARDQKTPAAKRAKPQPGPDLTGRAHEAGSTRWWRRAPGSPRRACALRLPPGASGSRVTPEVAGRARAGGAATFVIPCGRERESGAVEPPVCQTQVEASMAEQEPTAEQLAQIAAENEEDEHSVNYKPPAQKSIQEIQELDKDDESLRKYKEALLGRVTVSADPNVPNVVVTRLTLVCSTAPGPLELDLTGDLESFKKQSFVLKEGVEYRIKISFRVNREIVSGMKYIQHTYRKGVKIDKTDYMVGSYGPRAEEYEFLTPTEEAPKGMLARGSYNIKSRFTDDDKTDHLSWEWNLTIKKEWKD